MSFNNKPCIIHADMDAFFASVEQNDHVEYRGKPVIVGGSPKDRRNVVSTASYEARKFGVHAAMPTSKAFELCPNGIFVYPNMRRYAEVSESIMEIFRNYSPDVFPVSIDEAFVDITGTERLFGKPEDTAMRLKQEVKEKTGLTVSIGLASTAYIAKMCSDVKKPDGFFEVLPGDEENFILSTPLEKVWGIGKKTLLRLNQSGFYTTKDIHKHSLSLLESIFGTSSASFLYNVTHGIEPKSFFERPKTHSISVENTYPWDLTDSYAIETALLELSETVMFRLLRENLTGYTIGLKIRYDDFSTVSVQESSQTAITSVEYLFSRVCALFHKKYNDKQSIRLLGIAIQNTQKSSSPMQEELFDFGEKKRQKIEKSILDLEKKDSTIKIHKARLLNNKIRSFFALFILLTFTSFNANKVFADTSTTTVESDSAGTIVIDKTLPPLGGDSPSSLFDYNIFNQNVEFIADGYWDMALKQTTSMTFGYGNPFAISYGIPVFTQTVDLSLWFLLNKSWFFEAAFADGFEKNTIAVGYFGTGIVKEVRISNRKIIFPNTYSLDELNRGIGGGENQAPGISGHFEGKNWRADAAIRYDMLTSYDKTFYGKNSVTDTTIGQKDFLTGRQFALPSTDITKAIIGVYVESPTGTYTDTQGRKYKKLSTSQYLILAKRSMVVLSSDSGSSKSNNVLPAVAFQYDSSVNIESALGTFGTTAAPGTKFLGDIQKYFGSGTENDVPNVASFSYGGLGSSSDPSGTDVSGFFTTIAGEKVLLVQHPAGFSPFSVSYRYDAGTTAATDVAVSSTSTDSISTIYSAVISDDETALVSKNFFSSSHVYADVYVSSNTNSDITSPAIRYPFANISPGTYLNYKSSNDLAVRFRTYTPVSRFDIGTKAVAGTVRVYKNGVVDSGAKYDSESGSVSISSSVSDSDKVYITWYEDSGSSSTGAIAGAVGFEYAFSKNLKTDVGLSTRWSLSPDKNYAESSTLKQGFAAVSSRVSYETENVKLANTVGASVEADNVTGTYRVLGMDDASPSTTYLTQNAGKDLPSNFAPSLNAPAYTNSVQLDTAYKGSKTAQTGSTDSSITGYKIPVSWDFSSLSGSFNAWASTAIDLKGSSSMLSSCTKFSVALKTDNAISDTNYSLYLQLGVDASDDFTVENSKNIPTWKISSSSTYVESAFNMSSTSWQTVTVILNDEQRAQCVSNSSARLIVVYENPTGTTLQGTIYCGPYEVLNQGLFTSQDKNLTVTTEQVISTYSKASQFNTSKNYAQRIRWQAEGSVSDKNITAIKYFDEVDFSSYSEIEVLFAYTGSSSTTSTVEDAEGLTFILDRDASGIEDSGKTALKAVVKGSALKNYVSTTTDTYHCLTIDRLDNVVKIDGVKLASSDYSLFVNSGIVPTRSKFIINTNLQNSSDSNNSTQYTKGSFYIDEIYFSGSKVHFILEDSLKAAYKKDGVILKAKDTPIIENFNIEANGNGALTLYTNKLQNTNGAFAGNINTNVTLLTLNIAINAGRASDAKLPISNAGHSVSTTTPILKVLKASEEYQFDSTNYSLSKINDASLDFSPFKIPFVIKAKTKGTSDAWSKTQETRNEASLNLSFSKFGYTLNIIEEANQKVLPSTSGESRLPTNDYFESYLETSALQFSTGSSSASKRNIGGQINNIIRLPWISLAPEVNYSVNGKYTTSTTTLFTNEQVFETKFPFKIGKQSFSLGWKKEGGGVNSLSKGGSYLEDTSYLANTLSENSWYYSACPFYDLFSDELSKAVLSNSNMTTTSTDSLYYTGSYNFSWKRPIFANKKDFYIPSAATFEFARDVKTSESLSDTYQLKSSIVYTSFNIFGRNGSLPIAKWFIDDEYISSFTYILKKSRTEDNLFKQIFSCYTQANLYITKTDVLKSGIEFQIEDEHNWEGKGSVVWKRQGKFSPLLQIAKIFSKKLDTSKVPLIRTDSFNCTFSESSSSTSTKYTIRNYQSYELIHKLDMQVSKYASVNTSIAGSYSCVKDSICTLSFILGIGGRLEF